MQKQHELLQAKTIKMELTPFYISVGFGGENSNGEI